MATPTGGQVRPYGVAISDALSDPNSTLEDLNALRDQARRTLEEQGDLPGALEKLEAEIASRGGYSQGQGGIGILYGVVIHDALSDPQTTLERLTELRDQGRRQLEEHGDLEGSLKRLEGEIGSRQ
jgi:tetrahydromethanopterin S-methyltransferase subunit G